MTRAVSGWVSPMPGINMLLCWIYASCGVAVWDLWIDGRLRLGKVKIHMAVQSRRRCVAVSGGAGNFVKMVHNGIEYGDMQLISEAYDVLKTVGGLTNDELVEAFNEWNSVRAPAEEFCCSQARGFLELCCTFAILSRGLLP